MRQKYKAFSVHRDEVVKDVNHESWARIKRRILEIPDDVVAHKNTVSVVYQDVVDDVNFATYKETQKRVIDISADTTATSTSANISYENVLYDANIASWKSIGKKIVDKSSAAQSAFTINYADIKTSADVLSLKIANCRITDEEQSFEVKMDDSNVDKFVFANSLSKAIANVYRAIDFFLTGGTIDENAQSHTFSYNIADTSTANISVLNGLILQYLRSYTLYEWFKAVLPSEASVQLASAEETIQKIVEEAKSDNYNNTWYNRTWQSAIAEVKDELRDCITLGSIPTNADYTFNFRLAAGWKGSMEALQSYIHKFITDYILNEWFKIVMPEKNIYAEMITLSRNKMVAEAKSEDNNTKWFNRMWSSAIAQIQDELRFCINLNEEAPEAKDYTFTFRFQKGWMGSISVLADYIHRFIVDYILNEWAKRTKSDSLQISTSDLEGWKEKIMAEALSEEENHDWFERQLATAVDHLKGRLKWCIAEHTGTITDDTIKQHAIPYGSPEYPAVEQDFTSFDDDIEFLEAPTEKYVPMPEHTFRFRFSDAWRGSFEALGNYIHRYIVDYILYEWFRMTLPSEAPVYLASAEQWEDKVINEARSEDVGAVYFRL